MSPTARITDVFASNSASTSEQVWVPWESPQAEQRSTDNMSPTYARMGVGKVWTAGWVQNIAPRNPDGNTLAMFIWFVGHRHAKSQCHCSCCNQQPRPVRVGVQQAGCLRTVQDVSTASNDMSPRRPGVPAVKETRRWLRNMKAVDKKQDNKAF